MEGPISFWGYKEQESNLILPEHDDDETLKISFFKEFVTVATLQEVKRPEYSSPGLFKHRGRNEWSNASTPTLYISVYRDNFKIRVKYESRSSCYWKWQNTAYESDSVNALQVSLDTNSLENNVELCPGDKRLILITWIW